MSRLHIAARLGLIVVGAIILVQLLSVAIYFVEQRGRGEPSGFAALFAQVAALAEAIDRVPRDDRDLVLRAATTARFKPVVRQDVPPNPLHGRFLGSAEQRLRALSGVPAERLVALSFVNVRDGQQVARLRDLVTSRLQAIIELAGGGYLVIETAGELGLRLLGIPVGLLAGILGFVVALAALLAVRHETRPLSELTVAIERFGAAMETRPVSERGAPDVRALIRAVNAMQANIAELLRSRTLVLGAISHDLRTYVTRLRLRLELLPESVQRDKAIVDLDDMQSLMDDALAFVRASFAGPSAETVDLARVARTEYEARKGACEAVTLTCEDPSLLIRGSAAGMARVIANLVNNAILYGGAADISLHAETGVIDLLVEDRGPGIPVDERTRVFDPFYRLETSRSRESGGAGLGLTIVRQVVESNGGTVAIEDRPGGGTRVRVRLPRERPQ
ncbi:cell wall metabolism sensor histidine kinase WalK [Bradyrhizobium sp. CSS354]|uniref:sensor histidine kinase n=1 Tax=Bradyrhizobium sp. CSS354 TaxID=2699172 RepID=UPI0023B1F0F3|nr:ATP-binding protein [Bradyrhizobium sp. CSS354]MDE5465123.1 ATP-binding protein [Bradyrhizobium sp. CSS354]